MKYKDYYATLGVNRNASLSEIQKAYRVLARKYHPDVNKDKSAEEKFKEISEAYDVLKNPESRNKYDSLGANWKVGDQFSESAAGWQDISFDFGGDVSSGFSSFFSSIFGKKTQQRSDGAIKEEKSERVIDEIRHIGITPWEAILGSSVEVITATGRVNLKIPAGVQHGTRLRLKEKGKFAHGMRGDLYVELDIKIPLSISSKERELVQKLMDVSTFFPRKK